LTIGEVLVDAVQSASVSVSDRSIGRSPRLRRNLRLVNVYALLTPSEAANLRDRAMVAGRSVSDYVDCVIRGAG